MSPPLGTGLPYGLHMSRTGHKSPRGPSAGWWALTSTNTARNNGLTCLPKHEGAVTNTVGKLNAVWSQFVSGVSAINPLVAFYGIHCRREHCYSFFCRWYHGQLVNLNKYWLIIALKLVVTIFLNVNTYFNLVSFMLRLTFKRGDPA
jgi:hypothetical protein